MKALPATLHTRALLVVCSLLGIAAFTWPLFVPARDGTMAHAADAPVVFLLLVPMLLAVLVSEMTSGAMDGKVVAVLGALAALDALMRLPGGIGGFSPVFFLLFCAGRAYGSTFAFLLGTVSMFVSGVVTGGVGPWLPFQMFAAGWLAAGAGLLPPTREAGRAETLLLAGYGVVGAFAYGFITSLWFWPFIGHGTVFDYHPGAGPLANLGRYFAFYATTSVMWDVMGAVGNALLAITLARPVLKVLRRAGRHFRFQALPEFLPVAESPSREAA
ncbi:MAG: ECF transporter S component [Actinomycetota bacterium]